MPRQKKRPACTFHRPTGQARVRIDGKDHWLGKHDSPESRQKYDDLIDYAEGGQVGQRRSISSKSDLAEFGESRLHLNLVKLENASSLTKLRCSACANAGSSRLWAITTYYAFGQFRSFQVSASRLHSRLDFIGGVVCTVSRK
jgi:hypothetical protein